MMKTVVFVCAFAVSFAAAKADSLQRRIDDAPAGATIRVPAGTYQGSILIQKPLTLIGDNTPTIQGSGKGKVVHIAAEGVTVRGFRIRGSGLALFDDDAAVYVAANRATVEGNYIEDSLHGIYLRKSNQCRIAGNVITGKTTIAQESGPMGRGLGLSAENCDTAALVANRRGNGIHLWNCEYTSIVGNKITEARDGIYFSFANRTHCEGNTIEHVRYGLHYMYSDDNVFIRNVFRDSAAGAALMFSERLTIRRNEFVGNRGFRAYGLIFQSMDDCRLESNLIEGNAVGLSFNQCNRNRVLGNRVIRNYVGLRFGSNSDDNAFSANSFTHNLHAAEIAGENGSNHWTMAGVGNHWDAAVPFDLDRDGIHDMPHRELDLFGVLRRDFPVISLLSESPSLKLLRFAHQRAALPGVSSIEDRSPLAPDFPGLRALRTGVR